METRLKIETRIQLAEERFLLPLLHPATAPLDITAWEAPGEPVSWDDASGQSYQPAAEGDSWGRRWGTTWFHFTGTLPADWQGKDIVALIDLGFAEEEGFGREGLVWVDGKPVIALSRRRISIPLRSISTDGQSVDFYVEAAANPKEEWHWHDGAEPPDRPLYRITRARLAVFDAELFEFLLDFRVCREALAEIPDTTTRHARLLRGLDQACRRMERGHRDWLPSAKADLAPLLAATNGSTTHTITATGHAHIDTAWCWPLRETIRKCARTFATMLAYMEQHPEFRFSCSQPVQYLWMKHHYPSIFEGIQKAVKRGQWEPMGAMWVEPDCNVPSGESLVRQLLHGKEFFDREFSCNSHELWLPDVFGYSAALPQILQKAGVDRFLTQKISWNDTNRFPHHTFLWEGIDGTRIFSHFPPVDTYNARVEAHELSKAERQFAQKDRAHRSLMPYGFGDGGGGPTEEMIGRIQRFADFEGLPQVEFGTVDSFFTAAEADIEEPPVWCGELYLELHRGTYTSQAHNKLMNRRCEQSLREAEFLQTLAALHRPGHELIPTDPWPERTPWDVPGHGPQKESSLTASALDRAWKLVLLNQFHDILPGSSIHRVYEESRRDYEVIETIAKAISEGALDVLMEPDATTLTAINTLAHDRAEVVEFDGDPLWVSADSCGFRSFESLPTTLPEGVAAVVVTETAEGWQLDNGIVRVSVTSTGIVTSLVDLRTGLETLAAPANEFHLLRDYPNRWSAWDIEASAMDDYEIVGGNGSGECLEAGPLRAVLAIHRDFGSSKVSQRIILRAGSARLDFDTEIDWRERDRVLKVALPLAVRSDHSTCEIQYGNVRRATHRNTSWDAAKFEIPIHRWLDLSEPGRGVAVLNNGIFGCDILGSCVRLTLLKAGSAPDPVADLGIHRRTFSIFPHSGPVLEGGVIEEALALNAPLRLRRGRFTCGNEKSWLRTDTPGLTLEALKLAEDGKGVVMRWVESAGRSAHAAIQAELDLSFKESDLLERPLPSGEEPGALTVRAFDIRTFRATLA
ncbi:alpha-mannosidase [Haloferula luteola]|uniref:Alpha-mannosidase n=1 Tax=Haloferula luteola TaxID=595692 RepID=A0A840VCZ4_9BACT|nr:glycoside hydrolase family 38 C-terminal domain-containing protein [Haloferula luteola]MBB5351679.1 alpha-mannosidase [Haloferula luteola]